MKTLMLIKKVETKTLVTGDKSARITLETVNPADIQLISEVASMTIVNVEIYPQDGEKYVEEKKINIYNDGSVEYK